jgi:hypothetical protein
MAAHTLTRVQGARPAGVARLRPALILSSLAVALTALAAAGGLLLPWLYRDNPALVPVLQGQDLVTLLALPPLAWAMVAAARGSARGAIVWAGVLGYLCYTYLGAATAYHFNAFTPLYIALLGLTVFGLIALLTALDPAAIRSRFDERTPRRSVAAFLCFIAVCLGLAELAQIAPHLAADTLPPNMVVYGLSSYFVYALDLGLIVPLSALGAVWLLQDRPWGYVVAGMMLIKAAVMGLALLAMNWFALRAGHAADGLVPLWAAIALGGLALSFWFLGAARRPDR